AMEFLALLAALAEAHVAFEEAPGLAEVAHGAGERALGVAQDGAKHIVADDGVWVVPEEGLGAGAGGEVLVLLEEAHGLALFGGRERGGRSLAEGHAGPAEDGEAEAEGDQRGKNQGAEAGPHHAHCSPRSPPRRVLCGRFTLTKRQGRASMS